MVVEGARERRLRAGPLPVAHAAGGVAFGAVGSVPVARGVPGTRLLRAAGNEAPGCSPAARGAERLRAGLRRALRARRGAGALGGGERRGCAGAESVQLLGGPLRCCQRSLPRAPVQAWREDAARRTEINKTVSPKRGTRTYIRPRRCPMAWAGHLSLTCQGQERRRPLQGRLAPRQRHGGLTLAKVTSGRAGKGETI